MAKTGKMSKASGYQNRVYCAEYDLRGMIEAYGVDVIKWAANEIASGNTESVRAYMKAYAYRGTTNEMLDDALGVNNKYHL